jgi:hypothetical protein
MRSEVKRSVLKYTIWASVFTVAILACFVYYQVFYTYSEGFRAGTVTKLSNKGYIFKTYEGQLYTGALSADPNHARDIYGGQVWEFTVEGGNKEVVSAIETAVAAQERVKLFYHEKVKQYDWRGDTRYFVYKVEVVK